MRSRVDQGHALGDIGEKDIRCACILFGSIVCWLPNSSVSLFGSINMAAPTTSGAQVAGRPKRVEIYARLDEAFVELRERLGGLPDPTEADDIWTTIWYEEAHNSTPSKATPCPKAGRDATSRG